MKLYDYQREAIKKMHNGCILNGGTGSGKSITALAYFFEKIGGGKIDGTYSDMKHPIDLYIITTAKKRDSLEWQNELCPFILSTDPKRNHYKGMTVVVDSWNNIKKYADVSDSFFIFDEQKVSSFGTWAKTFIKISKNNQWILLTATAGDNWSDYVAIFVANGFYRNKTEFEREHCVFGRFRNYPYIERYINQGKLIVLRRKILVPMIFDRKTEQHHETVWCDYDKNITKKTIKNRWDYFNNEPIENASALCYTLRKIANSNPSRIKAVEEIVKETPKVIIFYNFDYELNALRSINYQKGTTVSEWNGHNHENIPLGTKWVYLVQYNACEGWNCITTDTIIFFSQNYSYKTMVQASGRIDRVNTPFKDLYYYHLKSTAGIDVAISKALKNKKKFNEYAYIRRMK